MCSGNKFISKTPSVLFVSTVFLHFHYTSDYIISHTSFCLPVQTGCQGTLKHPREKLYKITVSNMQECHSASNHEIQSINLIWLKLLWYIALKILKPLISTKVPKHKGMFHTIQTVSNQCLYQLHQNSKWTCTNDVWLNWWLLCYWFYLRYCGYKHCWHWWWGNTRGMAVKNRNLPAGHRESM
jgi:hypothetical protein